MGDGMRKVSSDRLGSMIARYAKSGEPLATRVQGLTLFRWDAPTAPASGVYQPSVCMVVQGAKRVTLGEESYRYDAEHFLLTAIHLPAEYQVIDASPEKPFLGLSLILDLGEASRLMADNHLPPPRGQLSCRGMSVGQQTPELLDALCRLVDLIGKERDLPIMVPLIHREILYRLMVGDQGARLGQIASAGTQGQQIARALDWLKQNYREPLSIDDLAARAGMSPSTFHHHFRALTARSPLQYQKRLRLQEARRLMLARSMDAASAGFEVGYESPSQFSREYSRLFGEPPLRDINRLRQQTTEA